MDKEIELLIQINVIRDLEIKLLNKTDVNNPIYLYT